MFVLCVSFAEPETSQSFRGSNVICVFCVVIVMPELLASGITLAQGTSISPVLLPPSSSSALRRRRRRGGRLPRSSLSSALRRRRHRRRGCLGRFVSAFVLAFRPCLLRCVAVVSALTWTPVLSRTRRRHRCVVVVELSRSRLL